MKLDWEFGERIQCSEDEKKECMALVADIVSMATKAKRNGLLSLVQDAEETSHFLLRKGLQQVLEGVNPQMVEKTLQYYILSTNHHGYQQLLKNSGVDTVLDGQNSFQYDAVH